MAATATRPKPRRRVATTPPAPSFDERVARGRAARAACPRSSHAEYVPPPARRDPVDVLSEQDATRVPELVPIRYGRMLVSAFTFYRGAAALMAGDLATSPVSGLQCQLCGDAHLSNFGVFSAPDRRLVFDLNDFDETLPGPFEWDVKRLAASLEVAGRDRGFKHRDRRAVVLACVSQYREAMRIFAGQGHLAVWYARLDVDDFIARYGGLVRARDIRSARRNLEKARSKDSSRALAKLTERVNGHVRIISTPPLVVPLGEMLPDREANEIEEGVRELLAGYQRTLAQDRRHLVSEYRFVDMAHKVVGVGSVGARAWIMLLEGRDAGDPLVLQAKEAGASVLERHLKASRYKNCGERVVQGQRFMQAASDIFLGWERVVGMDGKTRDFYVRQLWDGKGSAVIEEMDPARMGVYARMCGWTLARAHARSGDRVAIASYLGVKPTFDRAVADFADAYAEQNDLDYRALQAAVTDGRIQAQAGV